MKAGITNDTTASCISQVIGSQKSGPSKADIQLVDVTEDAGNGL